MAQLVVSLFGPSGTHACTPHAHHLHPLRPIPGCLHARDPCAPHPCLPCMPGCLHARAVRATRTLASLACQAFCMHMINVLQKIFRKEKLEKLAVGLRTYSIQSTSSQAGGEALATTTHIVERVCSA